jgi:hypothetical protein
MNKIHLFKLFLLANFLLVESLFAQNNSIQFDGNNDKIQVTGSAGFNSGNALTVEAWINASSWKPQSWQGTIVGKDQSNETGYVLRCGNNGILSFTIGLGNTNWNEVVSAPVMQTNTWHHVAAVMDNGTLRIFVDGVLVGSKASSAILPSTNLLLIGESAGFSGRVFDGKIDEVRIWNVARTQTQIQADMSVDLPTTTANLLGYYKMDTIANNTTPNHVGTASTQGILQNFPANPLVAGYFVPTLDISVKGVSAPDQITFFQGYSKVRAQFTNVANDTIQTFDVGYKLNNKPAVIETITQTILPGESFTYTLNTLLNTTDSINNLKVFASLSGDINNLNDTVFKRYVKPANPNNLEIPIFTRKQHNFAAAGQSHLAAVTLPDDNTAYSRIYMTLSLQCPNTGCDPWDQPAKISISKEGKIYEVARFITPYGKGCGPWIVDMTDYKTWLRGNVDFISYIQVWGGSGWLLNATLTYEKNPVANPYQLITPLWSSDNWVYGDPNKSHDLPAQNIFVPTAAKEVAMRMTISGHGQGNTDNAAEFSDKTHQVKVNGNSAMNHRLWKNDCSSNSCNNQAGTWLYARAGWCPGQAVDPFIGNLTAIATPGQTMSVDYELQNYVNLLNTGYNNNGHTEPHYKIHAYLVQKSDQYIDSTAFTNIAASAITSPSASAVLSATTPVKVMLRNYGSTSISNPSLELIVNGTSFSTEIASAAIAAGDSLEFTFSTLVGFNPQLVYEIVVAVTAANDEAASDDVINGVYGNVITAIESNEIAENAMSIYPNPTKGQFSLKGGVNGQELEVTIYGIKGNIVFNQLITKQFNDLELNPKLPSGTYIIKATANQSVVLNDKLIIIE